MTKHHIEIILGNCLKFFGSSVELWAKYGQNNLLNWRDEIPVYALGHLSHFACVIFPRVSSLIKTGEDTGNGFSLDKTSI